MSELERSVEEVVTGICARHATEAGDAQGLGASTPRWSRELWDDLEAAELTLASVPVANGGSEAGTGVAMAVLRAAARSAAYVPLAETLLAGQLLAACGESVPAGPLTAAVDGGGLRLRRGSGAPLLEGTLARVPWASRATTVVLVDENAGGPALVVLDADEVSIAAGSNLAGEPRDTITVAPELEPPRILDAPAGLADGFLAHGALCRAASMVGAAEAALALTIEYTAQRQQFGRPLARFQAVQQTLAVLISEVSAMRSATDSAAADFDQGAGLPVAAAKVVTSSGAGRVARAAHQLHGAIGFTDEYELHRFTSRLWSWRDEFGDETEWSGRLGHGVLGAPAGLWETISAGGGR